MTTTANRFVRFCEVHRTRHTGHYNFLTPRTNRPLRTQYSVPQGRGKKQQVLPLYSTPHHNEQDNAGHPATIKKIAIKSTPSASQVSTGSSLPDVNHFLALQTTHNPLHLSHLQPLVVRSPVRNEQRHLFLGFIPIAICGSC